jgi:hypothetical protein
MNPWQREMARLRMVSVLLGVTIASLIARAIISGLSVLITFTTTVMAALLLLVLRLIAQERSRGPRSRRAGR